MRTPRRLEGDYWPGRIRAMVAPMRLMFVSHSSELFGAEQSLLEIVREARHRGHEVMVLLPKAGPLASLMREAGAEVAFCPTYAWMGTWHRTPLGVVRLLQARLAVRQHQQLQRKYKPDYVVSNSSVIPSPAWAAKATRIPHVWIVRESLQSNATLKSALPKSRIAGQIGRLSVQVFVVSEFVESQVRSLGGIQTDREVCHIRPRPNLSAGRSTAWAPNERTYNQRLHLLIAGAVTKEKGQIVAVRAVGIAATMGIAVTLSIVGSGRKAAIDGVLREIRRASLEDLVHLHGWSTSMRDFYDTADCLIMASRNEAYGRTTAEALMTGLPVIGFALGGTTEILRSGGGILVNDISARGLAEAIVGFAGLSAACRRALRLEALQAGAALLAAESQFDALERGLAKAG